jgi:hypothetical protein
MSAVDTVGIDEEGADLPASTLLAAQQQPATTAAHSGANIGEVLNDIVFRSC